MNIVIFGASGGIGNVLTKHFDTIEHRLVLVYNRGIDNVCIPQYSKFDILPLHFYIDRIEEKIDVLINVMGSFDNALIKNMSYDAWTSVIHSNLDSIFLSCNKMIPKMNENSHIINISSVLGATGMIGASNYCAAKGGVEAFTRSLALELIRDKIFVNGIALGYFKVGLGLKLEEKVVESTKKKIALHEFGNPAEIVNLVDYIISSRYLVGQIIHLNGGFRI